jgi:hypothetical protein
MRGRNQETLREFAELLPLLFYALLVVSLLALATGAPGSGFLLLVLAGCTHVIRVGAEALVAQSGPGLHRPAYSEPSRKRSTASTRR